MNSGRQHLRCMRNFSIAAFSVCAALTAGCGSTIDETGENAKNFGVSVGKSAKEAGLAVGDAFKRTFGKKKNKDETPAEIKKAEPSNPEPKKQ
jgi:hypothetical protein